MALEFSSMAGDRQRRPTAGAARAAAKVALVLAFVHSSLLASLDPSLAITKYIHKSWLTAEGLPQNSIL
ncbi:MAG: hypothetical protein JOZ22_03775, partial [Acidobacteriia bacterium]|nr:hypothetical protein [Terriglobia bacterium]